MRFYIHFSINVRLLGGLISKDVDLVLTDLNKDCDEREMRGLRGFYQIMQRKTETENELNFLCRRKDHFLINNVKQSNDFNLFFVIQ